MRRLTDVRYSISLRQAVAAVLALSAASLQLTQIAHAQEATSEDVATLSDVSVTDDPLRALSNEPSGSSFGFAKPLLETPRSVSFVSEEQIRLFGVSTVEDLARVVPGTYTTTRYGLQGGINVRGVPADTYYRGMKRLNQQGHVRTVLSAMDNIEVVKGPPSPLFGMGKIGGYSVMDPKSSRAKTGKYMTKSTGFFQATAGAYQKNEIQVGAGIPFEVLGKQSGVYVFGLLENSNTYVRHVKAQQRFIQATTSVDNLVGPFRLETGGQLQQSITSGAYMNRVTQNLIDNGLYVSGNPLKDMDLDRNGRIGFVESVFASPVRGNLSSTNLPLRQRFNLPADINNPTVVPGIPVAMRDYLVAHPEVNCMAANVMRSMPVGGPLPTSGQLPIGFVLNPCTVKIQKVDYRGNGAYEREQNAHQKLGYVDLIYDTDPGFTVKNQFFYDNIDSFKDSWLPYGENQYIKAVEDKMTVTKAVPSEWLPDWMSVNSLASANYRYTYGWIDSGGVSGNDYDYRQDVMYSGGTGTGGHYPNTMFWTQLSNDSYANGSPGERLNESEYSEAGIGAMLDVTVFRNTNLVMGMRYDKAHAKAWDKREMNQTAGNIINPLTNLMRSEAEYINQTACTTAVTSAGVFGNDSAGAVAARAAGCPGYYYGGVYQTAKDTDSGKSWSISLSQQLPWGLRPYFTAASSSLTLDGSNNIIAASTIQNANGSYNGFIGDAYLREVGIKGAFFGGKLQASIAGYRQSRNDVTSPDDPSAGAEVGSTESEGIEVEARWAPTRELFLSTYYTHATQTYITPTSSSATIDVNGRQVGFQDVLDPVTGAVLYPAEAFLYGGRATAALPANSYAYSERAGTPVEQASIQGTYKFKQGFGLLLSSNWNSATWSNRQKTIELPSSLTVDMGATLDKGNMHLKFNVYNAFDEVYFRAATGDTNGQLVSVMSGRRWEISLKADF